MSTNFEEYSGALKVSHVLTWVQVVAGAGAIDHNQLVDLAGKSFAHLPTNPTTADDLVKKVFPPCDYITPVSAQYAFFVDDARIHDP